MTIAYVSAEACSVAHARAQAAVPDAALSALSGVTAVLDTMALGWNRGDLDLYLSGYADSATTRGYTGFVTGRAAARQVMMQGFWHSGRPAQQLHYEHLDVRALGSDYAVATGEYVLSGGGAQERTGWFTTIWTRAGRSWRCIHDHS